MRTKQEKLNDWVQSQILWRQRAALQHLKTLQETAAGDAPWEERTIRDAVSLKLVEMAAAGARAKDKAPRVNVAFGVVMMPARIEDAAKWEEAARQVGAAPPKAIEAEVVKETGDE